MELARFIAVRIEDILAQWDSFARTQQPDGANMSALALRDHARQILEAIVVDLQSEQTPPGRERNSPGLAARKVGAETAASIHGVLRQGSGFSLIQLHAEFRALRITVLTLWLPEIRTLDQRLARDVVSFNASIDQALAESMVTFNQKNLRNRDTFLAILGHDLRSPLQTLAMAGESLVTLGLDRLQTREVGVLVRRSAASAVAMVNDLLEYARTQLGSEIPVHPRPGDLGEVCRWALEDVSLAQPGCRFELVLEGDLAGCFDTGRVQQLLSNLLSNAVQYRDAHEAVRLSVAGYADSLVIKVANRGGVIPSDSLEAIFDPMVQLAMHADQPGRPLSSLGLGLFVARQIATGHGGRIEASSSHAGGTVFTVTLPRGNVA